MLNFLQVLEIAPTEWGTRLPAVDQDSRWSSDAGLRAVRAIAWSPYSAMFSAVDGEADRQPRRTSILPRQTCLGNVKTKPRVSSQVVAPCRRHRADDFLEETRMVSTDPSAAPLPPSEHQTQLRRAVIASTVGTTIEWHDIEWHDFFLYSTVTGLVFAKLFFPQSDPWVGTLEAFAIYAVAFGIGRCIASTDRACLGREQGVRPPDRDSRLLTSRMKFPVGTGVLRMAKRMVSTCWMVRL
jgi:hypothetical protein